MPRSRTSKPEHGRFDDREVESLAPGVTRVAITARRGRLARLRFEAGAGLPEHAHPQEEIVLVERGRLLFKLGETEYILGPGEFLLLPSGTAHEVRALGRREARAVITQFGVGVLARRGKGVL